MPTFVNIEHRHGAIYFKDTDVPEVQLIKVTSDLARETKDDVECRFAIGPSVQRELWAKERRNMSEYHGPCTNTTVKYQTRGSY